MQKYNMSRISSKKEMIVEQEYFRFEFTYGRGIYKSLKKVNLSKYDWYYKALDRLEWRSNINNFI